LIYIYIYIYDILFHLKQLEKEAQTKFKGSGRKEIINVREGINKIENMKIEKNQ
jgi:hypothetical protein